MDGMHPRPQQQGVGPGVIECGTKFDAQMQGCRRQRDHRAGHPLTNHRDLGCGEARRQRDRRSGSQSRFARSAVGWLSPNVRHHRFDIGGHHERLRRYRWSAVGGNRLGAGRRRRGRNRIRHRSIGGGSHVDQ